VGKSSELKLQRELREERNPNDNPVIGIELVHDELQISIAASQVPMYPGVGLP
jgi:hypothetical protein